MRRAIAILGMMGGRSLFGNGGSAITFREMWGGAIAILGMMGERSLFGDVRMCDRFCGDMGG
ncbi:hypothetical protein B6N60_05181 [Richelia sinica FACHB-800]|uniref:Uncharacterized protein n=1 Tax=Richelia sinica FACHB-800 TaxID=1357546 RepID=A0A975TD11_9NOST|nr:hypothetical protein B6N60_05181 [Richelia sinica FACHB-800]